MGAWKKARTQKITSHVYYKKTSDLHNFRNFVFLLVYLLKP